MSVVNVSDVPHPRRTLCYKQDPKTQYRCDRKTGHRGKCSWELLEEIERLRAENVQLVGQVNVALGHT